MCGDVDMRGPLGDEWHFSVSKRGYRPHLIKNTRREHPVVEIDNSVDRAIIERSEVESFQNIVRDRSSSILDQDWLGNVWQGRPTLELYGLVV